METLEREHFTVSMSDICPKELLNYRVTLFNGMIEHWNRER